VSDEDTAWTGSGILALILLAILLAGLMVAGTVGFRRRRPVSEIVGTANNQTAFDLKTVSSPKGLFYDKTHTWAFMEADGRVKIGIDDFLQQLTGTITRVEMKKPGDKITRGDMLVTVIQQGKQLRLYAPVTGTIRESNPALINDSSLINSAPFTEGWIYRVEPANWLGEIPLLKMAVKYTQWLSEEWVRVKDFFTNAIRSRHLEYSAIILQDGGLLKNHLLEDFGPEVWEDFQDKILDSQV
jgi:glycine cleavage system H lipoate-binding protein